MTIFFSNIFQTHGFKFSMHPRSLDALQQLFEEIRNMYTLFVQSMVNKDQHFSGHKSIK